VTEWGVIPSIRVRDMTEALAFYRGTLEFTLDSGGDDATNSSLTRGSAHVMIETAADLYGDRYNAAIRKRLGNPSAIDLYMEASDVPAFYSRLQAAGVRVVDPLARRPWGLQQFTIEDLEGNWLTFWQRVAPS
jgi:uncharacterized glyoxalase superfamily protein PhnB